VLVGLALATVKAAAFTAWAIFIHATWRFVWGHETPDRLGQSTFGRGMHILTQHEHFTAGAIVAIVAVVVAAVMFFLIYRGKRWPYLVVAVGSLAAIVPAWIVRSQVWDTERAMSRSTAWAARSPYVMIATVIALAITIYFAVLAIAATVAWLTSRRDDA